MNFARVHPNKHSKTILVRNGFAWAVRIATVGDFSPIEKTRIGNVFHRLFRSRLV